MALSGLAVAAPASAATATVQLENTTFTEGSWGAGLSGSASGFTPNVEVTIHVWKILEDGSQMSYGPEEHLVSDENGNITFSGYVPAEPPVAGLVSWFDAVYAGTGSIEMDRGTVELTILPAFVAAEPSIAVTPTCSTPDQITSDGVVVTATGFAQGEAVTDSLVGPDGFVYEDDFRTADETGSVEFSYTLTGTDIPQGTYTETLTGEFGLVLTKTFIVGSCEAVVPPVETPVVEAPVVVPVGTSVSGQTLAATGATSSEPLLAGTALLLLVGLSVFLHARRQTAS